MTLNLPRGFTYLAVALVAGSVATYALHRYIKAKTDVPKVATASVVLATSDVAPGTPIKIGQIRTASWPLENIPPQAANSSSQVDNRVALVPISPGEPVLMSKLAPVGTAAGLSSLLADGKRAMAVRVDDVTGVSGFITPGDRVDVLVDAKFIDSEDKFSKTILQNLQVLTAGQHWEQKSDGKPVVVNTVTLEVSPDEAEILNVASLEGKIRLSLRGRRNPAVVETKGVAFSELLGQTRAKKNDATMETQAATLPAKPERTVEVINGLERTQAAM